MLYSRLSHLGHLSVEEFLRDYWQKKPLFLPNTFPDLPQVDPNELAGFALEQDIESRLITETPAKTDSAWQVNHGPLDENIFASLPESHWTLLVQAVDQLMPELHSLLNCFRFLPNWRLDDIMVSYAVDQGSVGPHFDYYDVFLLQASGQRQWKIGQTCTSESPLQPNTELKLLQQFETQHTYTVNPGDLLYIPPNVAHWGVAQGESVTYSVGFRAPSVAEIITEFADYLSQTFNEDTRYSDAGLTLRSNPGEVTADDIGRVQNLLQTALGPESIGQWLAQYMTQAKRESLSFTPEGDDTHQLMPSVRCAYVQQQNQKAKLFINGEEFLTSLKFAQMLCSYSEIAVETLNESELKLLNELQNLGYIN